MYLPDFSVNQYGHLTVGGVDCAALCAQYGSPLYVVDEYAMKRRCRDFVRYINEYFPGGRVAYASKAFCCKEICRIISYEGLHLDVVSGGELHTALAADVPPERIILHGYNKTIGELLDALKYNVGRIVVDSFEELGLLAQLAQDKGAVPNVLLRITPGILAKTHQAVMTGAEDSKFGFSITAGDAMRAVTEALASPFLNLCGLHSHIGSQITDIRPFALTAQRMAEFLMQIKHHTGKTLAELNLGGGYAIAYHDDDDVPQPEEYLSMMSQALRVKCTEYGLSIPQVIIEPGRSLVGPCGITLYTAGSIKQMSNGRIYIAIDGGMTDNPRYALYRARYRAVVANRINQPKNQAVTLAGRSCESGDLIGEEMPLGQVTAGDIIAVFSTGAYNFSMASNYNRLPRPAVVMVSDGNARLVVARQRVEDMLLLDI